MYRSLVRSNEMLKDSQYGTPSRAPGDTARGFCTRNSRGGVLHMVVMLHFFSRCSCAECTLCRMTAMGDRFTESSNKERLPASVLRRVGDKNAHMELHSYNTPAYDECRGGMIAKACLHSMSCHK